MKRLKASIEAMAPAMPPTMEKPSACTPDSSAFAVPKNMAPQSAPEPGGDGIGAGMRHAVGGQRVGRQEMARHQPEGRHRREPGRDVEDGVDVGQAEVGHLALPFLAIMAPLVSGVERTRSLAAVSAIRTILRSS